MAEQKNPDWLTAEFLKSCLETDKENFTKISISSFSAEPAVAVGMNYGSQMLRVKIHYKKPYRDGKEHLISLVIKAPLTTGHMEHLSDVANEIYKKEPKFYNEFINETYKLMKHDAVPKCYVSPNPYCVVLEDLKESGYEMIDRKKLLDYDHCVLYIEESAKLEALSMKVNQIKPELIQSLSDETPEVKASGEKIAKSMMTKGFSCFCAYIEDKPNCKDYYNLVSQFNENDCFWNIYQEVENTSKPLKALIRTDPWCTNMMFKYDSSKKPYGIKLFDFQTLKAASPIVEFVYFVWLSIKPEVREEKLGDIYNLYVESLNKNLSTLGCPERVSLEELKSEILFLSPIVLMVVCVFLPLCAGDEVIDLSDIIFGEMTGPVKESKLYKRYEAGSVYSKYCLQIVSQVAREGVFDYMKQKIGQGKQAKKQT